MAKTFNTLMLLQAEVLIAMDAMSQVRFAADAGIDATHGPENAGKVGDQYGWS